MTIWGPTRYYCMGCGEELSSPIPFDGPGVYEWYHGCGRYIGSYAHLTDDLPEDPHPC